jgi:hypothetical protein
LIPALVDLLFDIDQLVDKVQAEAASGKFPESDAEVPFERIPQ